MLRHTLLLLASVASQILLKVLNILVLFIIGLQSGCMPAYLPSKGLCLACSFF